MADNCTYTDLAGRVKTRARKNVRDSSGFFECVHFFRSIPGRAGTKCTPEGISHVLLSCIAMLLLLEDLTRDVVRLCARRTTRRACAGVVCVSDLRVQTDCGRNKEGRRHDREHSADTDCPLVHLQCAREILAESLSLILSTRSVSGNERRKKKSFVVVVCIQQAQQSEERDAERGGASADMQSASAGSLSLIFFYSLAPVPLCRYAPSSSLAVWTLISRRKIGQDGVCVCVRETRLCIKEDRKRGTKKEMTKYAYLLSRAVPPVYAPRVVGEEKKTICK